MASTVATPLERHLGAIADVDDMTSTSSVGNTQHPAHLWPRSRHRRRGARRAGRDRRGARRPALVADAQPLLSQAQQLQLFPSWPIAMTSDVLTQGQIYDAADAVVSQRLSQFQGVGGVNVNGSALPAVRVEINPLSALQVRHRPAGRARGDFQRQRQCAQGRRSNPTGCTTRSTPTTTRATRPTTVNLIIANRNGATVRLGDVANVLDMQDGATENIRTYGLYNGKPAVPVQVFQQPGANIIELVDAVKAELPLLKACRSIRRSTWSSPSTARSPSAPRCARSSRRSAGGRHGDPGRLYVPATAPGPR